MKRPLLLVVAVLAALTMGGEVWAQDQVPIGPSASRDTVTGAISRSIGPGGAPVLNYQKADSSWDVIVDDWVQVGDRQVWKSVRGNHRVFADSTGAAIYAKGNHYLGISPGPLVKFDKSDSTWVTLKPSLPDSVSISGRTITFHNVYPGIDLRLVNNAKVFQRFAYQVVFHQEARDSLAAWGPWGGYLLGTATRLSIDSLNLTLRDAEGVFSVGLTGRMVNEWVSFGSADTAAFYLGTTHLQTEDSTVWSIPVRKWLVRFAGSLWLVELFDPIKAGALPAGDLWHDVRFGYDGGPGGASLSLNDNIRGDTATMGATAGTVDEIVCYMTDCGGNTSPDDSSKFGIYLESDESFVGEADEETPGGDSVGWLGRPASGTINLAADTKYIICAWTNFASNAKAEIGTGANVTLKDEETYNGFPGSATFTNITFNKLMSIYVVYTEDVTAGQIIIIGD